MVTISDFLEPWMNTDLNIMLIDRSEEDWHIAAYNTVSTLYIGHFTALPMIFKDCKVIGVLLDPVESYGIVIYIDVEKEVEKGTLPEGIPHMDFFVDPLDITNSVDTYNALYEEFSIEFGVNPKFQGGR